MEFLWVWVELDIMSLGVGGIEISSGVGGIGQNSCESRCKWLEFLFKWVELVRISLIEGGIGQNSCNRRWDWSEFLDEKVGLVRIPV